MGFMLVGKYQNLPQTDLEGRSRSSVKDPDSPFVNVDNVVTPTVKQVLRCSVQPITGTAVKNYESQLNMEGFKNMEAYHLFTDTKLVVGVEGTGILSDQVKMESVTGLQLWFTVVRALHHPYSGVARYKYLVVLDTSSL